MARLVAVTWILPPGCISREVTLCIALVPAICLASLMPFLHGMKIGLLVLTGRHYLQRHIPSS